MTKFSPVFFAIGWGKKRKKKTCKKLDRGWEQQQKKKIEKYVGWGGQKKRN